MFDDVRTQNAWISVAFYGSCKVCRPLGVAIPVAGGRGLLHQELPMRRWRSLENRDPGSGFLRRSSGCQPGFFMVVSYDFRRDIFLGYFFRRLNRDLLRYIPGMFLDGSGGFTLFKSCLLLENPLEMELWGFPAMILRAGIPQRN